MPPSTNSSGPQPDAAAVLLGMVRDMREESRQDAATIRDALNRVALELNSLHAARLPQRIDDAEKRIRELELSGERDRARVGLQSAIAGALASGLLSGLVYLVTRSIHP